jgi:hypothetical protein
LVFILSPHGRDFSVKTLGCSQIILERNCHNLAHAMAFVNVMRVIVAKNTAMIHLGYVRQEKGEVVVLHFPFTVDPNLFPKNANASRAPEPGLVIGVLAEMTLSPHKERIAQVIHLKHHLINADLKRLVVFI